MAESTGVTPTWRSSLPTMGTHVDIIDWGGDGMAIVNAVVGVVVRHKDMWSVFRPSSGVSRLNTAVVSTGCDGGAPRYGADSAVAGLGLIASEETDQLLRDASVLAKATGGTFNLLIGPLIAARDVKSIRAAYVVDAPLPPTPSEHVVETMLRALLWGLLSRVGERCWVMGLSGESVGGVDVSSPSLNLGGIAKGRTAGAYRDLAVVVGTRGVPVSIETSSVSVFGARADGSSQHAGLRDPQGGPTSVADIIELPTGGMASPSMSDDNLGSLGDVCAVYAGSAAGSAAGPPMGPAADCRARETSRETSVGGDRVFDHHIIDPCTGYPAYTGVRQVNVVASSDVLMETLSMVLLVDPSTDVSDVVVRWSRLPGTLTSAKVVGIVRAEQG